MIRRCAKGVVLSGVLAGLLMAPVARAQVQNDVQGFVLPKVLSSNMVLQRDVPVRLWGWAVPNQTVHVVLEREGKSFPGEALTAGDGLWEVSLPSQAVCTAPCSLTFTTGAPAGHPIVLTDILFGDVWLVSGQSNMEKKVGHLLEAAEIIERADQSDLIRSFRTRYNVQDEPQEKVNPSTDPWFVVGSSNVASQVSAVAYCFALNVSEATNIPLGLLQAYHGGTEIETWLSADRLQNDLNLSRVRDRDWKAPGRKAYAAHYAVNYNGQIHPLIRFPVKGILWCQGESNTKRALEYAVLQKALVQDWRQKWNCGALPFLFVQLFNMGPTEDSLYVENNWCDLRDQQLSFLSEGITNTAMAVSIDTNEDPNNPNSMIRIHPKNKKPIGDRLAMLALKNVYGHELMAESPLVDSYSIEGNTIAITFENAGAGLKAREGETQLKGFVIAGSDRIFHPAEAQIVGDNQVRVRSQSVNSPVSVRYGWAKNPDCNLYNSADLPASPFRLDDWRSLYSY